MLASADRLSVAEWEAELLRRRPSHEDRPSTDMLAALRRQMQSLAKRSKVQNQSLHLGSSGIPALNNLRKPSLELMLLAHQELSALERADHPMIPAECLDRLLNEIAVRLTELDNCLNVIRTARLTAELAGPTIADLARGRGLPVKRFRPVLDQLLAENPSVNPTALASLSALRWTEPDVGPDPIPDWFWATAIPSARWMAAWTLNNLRSTPQLREAQVLAALLMDIGQIALSAGQSRGRVISGVLHQRHPEVSAAMIASIQGAFAESSTWAGRHHERMDGSGFPRNLSRHQLCFVARTISAVARWTELLKAGIAASTPQDAVSHAAVLLWKETLAGGFDEAIVKDLLAAVDSELLAAVQRAFLEGAWQRQDTAHAALAGPRHAFGNDSARERTIVASSQVMKRAVP